jgi:lambda family phage portal protein
MRDLARNVVGTGHKPQANTGTPTKDKALEEVFAERSKLLSPAEGLPYPALQYLRFLKFLEDGEIFVVKSWGPGGTYTETVEADRVMTPMGKTESFELRHGVVKDSRGVPTGYWVADRHPGDVYGLVHDTEFKLIPKDRCYHLANIVRPGQTRGVPPLHAVLQDLHDLDLLLVASLKRVQIAACLALFIETEQDPVNLMDLETETHRYIMEDTIDPGMIMVLKSGEKVHNLVPNFPTPQLEPFVFMLARRIGAAVGVSWQTVLKDWSKSTYSSARTQLLDERQEYKRLRVLFQDLLTWEWKAVLEGAQMAGEPRMVGVTPEDLDKVAWIAPGWQWVDPDKEAKAVAAMLETGLTTFQIEAAKLGRDWQELVIQRLEYEQFEAEERKARGLEPPEPEIPGEEPNNEDAEQDPEPEETPDSTNPSNKALGAPVSSRSLNRLPGNGGHIAVPQFSPHT